MRSWALYYSHREAEALEGFAHVAEHGEHWQLNNALLFLGQIVADLDWDGDDRTDAVIDVARPEVHAFLARHPALAPEVLWRAGLDCISVASYARALAYDTVILQRYPGSTREQEVIARIASTRASMSP
jgi:hypothetical protein